MWCSLVTRELAKLVPRVQIPAPASLESVRLFCVIRKVTILAAHWVTYFNYRRILYQNMAKNGTKSDLTAMDQLSIIQTTVQMGKLTDDRNWDQLLDIFTDEVYVDYSRLSGLEASSMPRTELIDGWKIIIDSLDATQHMITNHDLNSGPDSVDVEAYVQATHLGKRAKDGPLWTIGAKYKFVLVKSNRKWKIKRLSIFPIWQSGNLQLLQQV